MALHRQLQALKGQIEQQLQWGNSTTWSSYDFEKLSELVHQKTGVSLSVSTLKGIFGKVTYTGGPSTTTLNTLAQFLDVADWRAFTLGQSEGVTNNQITVGMTPQPVVARPTRSQGYVLLALAGSSVVCLLVLFWLTSRNMPLSNKPEDFSFHSNTMNRKGLPNSIVFTFDASKAQAQDSVFICQDWDARRKVLVDKKDRHHSAIYYYPGYFRAKLMIGSRVVKEHDVQINTKGWLGLVEADWGVEPLYFSPADIQRPGSVGVTKTLLDRYHLPLLPSPPTVLLYNQPPIRGIMSNNFTFETEVRSEYSQGASACQRIQILLQAKNDLLIVPIVQQGCVGDIFLYAYGQYMPGSRADLSGFGGQLTKWTSLR